MTLEFPELHDYGGTPVWGCPYSMDPFLAHGVHNTKYVQIFSPPPQYVRTIYVQNKTDQNVAIMLFKAECYLYFMSVIGLHYIII